MKNEMKAVLFDMDGVLVDAAELHYAALNSALSGYGYAIKRSEHESIYNGLPTLRKLRILGREKGIPIAVQEAIASRKQRETVRMIPVCLAVSRQKQEMLDALRGMGIRLAVCSNSIRSSVELMLEATGILHFFDCIVSNEDVAKAKPDPEMYRKAMLQLDVKPFECVAVEDSPHGLEAARLSGARVCAVAGCCEVTLERIISFMAKGGGAC